MTISSHSHEFDFSKLKNAMRKSKILQVSCFVMPLVLVMTTANPKSIEARELSELTDSEFSVIASDAISGRASIESLKLWSSVPTLNRIDRLRICYLPKSFIENISNEDFEKWIRRESVLSRVSNNNFKPNANSIFNSIDAAEVDRIVADLVNISRDGDLDRLTRVASVLALTAPNPDELRECLSAMILSSAFERHRFSGFDQWAAPIFAIGDRSKELSILVDLARMHACLGEMLGIVRTTRNMDSLRLEQKQLHERLRRGKLRMPFVLGTHAPEIKRRLELTLDKGKILIETTNGEIYEEYFAKDFLDSIARELRNSFFHGLSSLACDMMRKDVASGRAERYSERLPDVRLICGRALLCDDPHTQLRSYSNLRQSLDEARDNGEVLDVTVDIKCHEILESSLSRPILFGVRVRFLRDEAIRFIAVGKEMEEMCTLKNEPDSAPKKE